MTNSDVVYVIYALDSSVQYDLWNQLFSRRLGLFFRWPDNGPAEQAVKANSGEVMKRLTIFDGFREDEKKVSWIFSFLVVFSSMKHRFSFGPTTHQRFCIEMPQRGKKPSQLCVHMVRLSPALTRDNNRMCETILSVPLVSNLIQLARCFEICTSTVSTWLINMQRRWQFELFSMIYPSKKSTHWGDKNYPLLYRVSSHHKLI